MLRYKIKKISEIDITQLSDFYRKVYFQRHKSLISNWRWWYRVGHGKFEPLLLLIDDKVIGQAGLLPTDLRIKEKKVPAIWFVDFVILPEFRGKGLGELLTKEWMKICPNQITFCNNQSLKVFKKLGWKNNLSTQRLLKPINPMKFLPFLRKIELNFANKIYRKLIKKRFSRSILISPRAIIDNYNFIDDSFKKQKPVKNEKFAEIIRDEKWFYWRLMECPYKKNLYFFEHKNNFAIVNIYSNNKIKRLNILYTYSLENHNQENELLILITNWAIENNIDMLWAVKKNQEFINIFPNILTKSMNFASWSSDEKIFEVLQNGLSDPQGIDSDIDSCLYID